MSKQATAHLHHAMDYIEITVADVGIAKDFYASAFGWTFNDYGPDYAGIVGSNKEMGGLSQGETIVGGPLVILFSESLEQTLAAVTNAGGTITKDPFDFPGGRRFHFADPSGNQLAVWAHP